MKHFYIQVGLIGRDKPLNLAFNSDYERGQAMLNLLGTSKGYAIITTAFTTIYIKVDSITYIMQEGEIE